MAGKAGKRVGLLTARQVKTAKVGLHGDGANLFLKVNDGGARSWIFRHQVNGKVRKIGLGPTHTVGLSDARERAEAIRRQLLDGIDPREARRAKQEEEAVAAAKSISFDDAAKEYIAAQEAGWRSDKHAKQWQATLSTYASPVFGGLPVSAIDTELVLKVVEPIWKTKNETAHRVRGRIEQVLGWALAKKFRSGDNPAEWKTLKHLLAKRKNVHKVEHHAALPYIELPRFMRDLRKRYGIGPLALELTILCATRTSETLNATWSEFDLDGKLWTIPPRRMKAGVKHCVPLCDRAVAIVREMRTVKASEFVFPGAKRGKPLSNMALLTVLRRMERGDVTVHGFRSTFRDWATEHDKVREVVAEAALAHGVKDKTEAAYRRATYLDERTALMQRWAAYCDSRVSTGKVVALR